MRPKPAINEIYHIFNRGVEKRIVFLNDADKKRFVQNLYIFNDSTPIINNNRPDLREVRLLSEEREKLVEILAFTLMPNHYHLMLKQVAENGRTECMRKIGTGYTNYFNTKYQRVGSLFQGKYKAALLENQRHFMYLPHYIHLNPLDIKFPEWRKRRLKNIEITIEFIESYPWSSYAEYVGLPSKLPKLVDEKFINEFFEDSQQYQKDLKEWLLENNFNGIEDIALEP
jgi:putative transposase